MRILRMIRICAGASAEQSAEAFGHGHIGRTDKQTYKGHDNHSQHKGQQNKSVSSVLFL